MARACRVVQLLTSTLVRLLLNLSELVKRIVFLLFFLEVVFTFFPSWRIRLIIFDEIVDLIKSPNRFVGLNFDQLRLDHDLPLDMVIVVLHDGNPDLKIRLHDLVRNFALTHE